LLLSNAQDDLKPLEIGLHVLKAVPKAKGGRGNKGGIAEYARLMGSKERTLKDWVCAAEVADKVGDRSPGLIDYTIALSIIHRADASDWAAACGVFASGGD
jgi:hypothetical protein